MKKIKTLLKYFNSPPIENKQYPIENKQVPIENKQYPIENKQAPIENNQYPIEIFQYPIEKSANVIIQDANSNINTSSSSSQKKEAEEDAHRNISEKNIPPPQKNTDVLALKEILKNLNPILVFNHDFYLNALRFMARHNLNSNYPPWLYNHCLKKSPKSIAGFFFTVFCQERFAELFQDESRRPQSKSPPPTPTISCPVCNASHPENTPCPACGLTESERTDPKKVDKLKKLAALPPDIRQNYERDMQNAYASLHTSKGFSQTDLEAAFAKANSINALYGIPND